MLERLKYIVYEKDGCVESLMFPSLYGHDEMARRMSADKVLGAGFCKPKVNDDGMMSIVCYGGSISLNIESRGNSDSMRVTLDHFGLDYEL
jgi:hypothetical protein